MSSPSESTTMLKSLEANLSMADSLVRVFYREGDDGVWKFSEQGLFIGRYFENGGTPGQLLTVLADHIEKRLHTDTMSAFNPPPPTGPSATSAAPDPHSTSAVDNFTARYKLIFFAPAPTLEGIKRAVFAVGAGTGYPGSKHTSVSFETPGVGQFQLESETAIGKLRDDGSIEYRLERVEEIRCEVLCMGRETLEKAVEALKRTHPYEEPAYEAYQIENV